MSKSLPVLAPADAVACCSPLAREPLSQAQAEQVAPLLKALADPVRLRLMSLVASHEGGEACICDLNPVTADHIYTAFKGLAWRVPSDLVNTLQQAGSKGWLDTANSADIKVTPMGENLVEHDLPKS